MLQRHRKTASRFLHAVIVTAGLGASWAWADTLPLILEYRFDETGTTAPSTGAVTTALNLYQPTGLADLHGPAGSGVGGGSVDRALDLSAAGGMGNNAPLTPVNQAAYRAQHAADNAAIDALTSVTVSGWYKTATAGATLDRYAHLVDNHNESNAGFLIGATSGLAHGLILRFDSTQINLAAPGAFNDANVWVFFAVTYDGTLTSNNVKVYRGYRNATEAEAAGHGVLELVATLTANEGTLGDDVEALYVGNADNQQRPFDGFMDNVRIHGSKIDGSGALGFDAISSMRGSDVPEPAVVGLLGCGLVLLTRRERFGSAH